MLFSFKFTFKLVRTLPNNFKHTINEYVLYNISKAILVINSRTLNITCK